MSWFAIGLLAPAIWGVANHIDKYLVSISFRRQGIGAPILLSAFFELLVPPLVWHFHPEVVHVGFLPATLATLGGAMGSLAILVYLYAMREDEASYVVPLFQLTPVMTFILGLTVFHDLISGRQALGVAVIIFGSAWLSLRFRGRLPKLKLKVLALMFLSSALIALGGLIFKLIALDTSFWATIFWTYVSGPIVGLLLWAGVAGYRKDLQRTLSRRSAKVIALDLLDETLTVIGGLIFSFVILIAPFSLAWTVDGFQALFVFIYGVLLTWFFPKVCKESLQPWELCHKFAAILLMLLGVYLLGV